ncbi:PH domain-containing protein [Streptomyces sp. 7N604]|uniref:PH domain-containing protein n=1 Tax=Streptomyces sp. 7N604 TaxID=3457415 RepID=UPI003FD16C80
MTSPDDSSADRPAPEPHEPEQAQRPQQPQYADRAYRSPASLAGGVLLLALALWLGGDAVIRGEGRTPWLALSGLLLVVPLVVAYTLRPAVFAGARRLRVRNPFRTITLPWASVEEVRASYSSEVFAGGRKYQLWAIPVSLRARKRAARQSARAAAASGNAYGRASATTDAAGATTSPAAHRAPSDQAVDELRELAERHASDEASQGEPVVRWAYEIIAPSAVGAVLLAVLLATG